MNGKNSYLKPQDIIILLKILTKGGGSWKIADLAYELDLSSGEVSNALARLKNSKLISADKKTPMLKNLEEFLFFGLKYAFPAQMGPVERGVPTAHSIGALEKMIVSDTKYVWPSAEGTMKGISISPLYRNSAKAAIRDSSLHKLLALVDALRVGKVREQKLAIKELKKELNSYEL